MICGNCKTVNDLENVFCVGCGATVSGKQSEETVVVPDGSPSQHQNHGTTDSVETSVLPLQQFDHSPHVFSPPTGSSAAIPQVRKRNPLVWVGLPLLLVVVIGLGSFLIYTKYLNNNPNLPDHFGMFIQAGENESPKELTKLDVTSLLEAKNQILEKDSLPETKKKQNWILFAENNDVPLKNLRLLQVDSIDENGSLIQLDFQAAPVEGRPEMKRIRVSKELAKGKYAFALIDGFLDDGKHKLWAFEVKTGPSDNGDLAKSVSIPTKLKEKAPVAVEVPQPPGSTVAYVAQANVIMRSGPSQSSSAVGKFSRGQKVYVISVSGNYESFKNLYSNYSQVQTTSGKRAWVYTAFLR